MSIIEKDVKTKKHNFMHIPSSSKNNFPIQKKLSQKFQQIGKSKLKNRGSDKNIKLKTRRKKREKSFIINKNNLYTRLMKKNDSKKNFNTRNTLTNKYSRRNTYLPKSHFLEEINLSDEKKDENDIRNILNLSKNQYKQFSKCCDEIKDRLLLSPYKTKRTKTKSSKNSLI